MSKKIMAIASSGGHWVQLQRLRPAWSGMDVTYVSTDMGLKNVVLAQAKEAGEPEPKFMVVTEANRWQKASLIRQLFGLLLVFVKTRPDVVITTGAAPGYFALAIGKVFRAKTVWIDSIANAEDMSLSGKKVERFADLWITQWEDLSSPDGPTFIGAVL